MFTSPQDVKVVDNFYEDPSHVVLTTRHNFPIVGCGSGARTIPLKEIDQSLYKSFCDKIYSLHNIDASNLFMTTFFMEHETSSIDILNQRFVHIDGKNPDVCYMTMEEYKLVLCGQIFLTENPDPEAGIKFHKLKDSINWSEKELMDNCINNYLDPKVAFEAGKLSLEEYKKEHRKYHDNFELTQVVENVYNRMVSWRAGTLHGDPMTKRMNRRLTQYFFLQKL